jgi:hypothetical protein
LRSRLRARARVPARVRARARVRAHRVVEEREELVLEVEELGRVGLLEARPVANVRMLRGEQAEAAVGEDARGRTLELRVLPRR